LEEEGVAAELLASFFLSVTFEAILNKRLSKLDILRQQR